MESFPKKTHSQIIQSYRRTGERLKLMILLKPSTNKPQLWNSSNEYPSFFWKLLRYLYRLKLQMLIKTVCLRKLRAQTMTNSKVIAWWNISLDGLVPCSFPNFPSSSEAERVVSEHWRVNFAGELKPSTYNSLL